MNPQITEKKLNKKHDLAYGLLLTTKVVVTPTEARGTLGTRFTKFVWVLIVVITATKIRRKKNWKLRLNL